MMEQNKDLVNHNNHMSDIVNTENISKGVGQAVPDEAERTNQNTEKQQKNTDNIYSFNKDKMYNINQNYAILDRPQSSEDIGLTDLVEHTINTRNHPPVRQRPRRIPLARMKDAEAEIQKMVRQDIIEPSTSPWNSNIVLMKKSDDDIIVFSKSFEEHMKNLKEVFQRLKAANLKLNPKKYNFLKKEVKFLGHIVSESGVATDPNKIQSVKDWPVPKKTTLISAPVLAYPTREDLFILDTDASNDGIGAVLSQLQDGVEKVICYFSKTFSRSEKKYRVTRRELLAVVASIKHVHHYLYGKYFEVRSDHGALSWLFNFKNPEGQLARWFDVLASYDFKIEHRAGRSHNNADALSRRPCYNKECPHCARAGINYELVPTHKNV
ncbi:unnamed protein product [Mytilus edulis]|uniref:Reverse transcriptase RNase H-like domain-containing protein n=1 Tax=Mytilus edulis TaxID=6550 RepID=A0A8S3SYT1_MYTED|nr:unnamed protein product [Mytilus edulis]